MDPTIRMKNLFDQGSSVDVDHNIPVKRYFRSGIEMSKIAHIYEEEGNYESAYILYIRFMTLFVEKIREHPEYKVHSSSEKATASKKVKEILPIAEKIKEIIKRKYQGEYDSFVEFQRKEEAALEAKKKQVQIDREKAKKLQDEGQPTTQLVVTPAGESFHQEPILEDLTYPLDSLEDDQSKNARPMGIEPLSDINAQAYPPSIPSRDLKPHESVPSFDRSIKPSSLMSADVGHKSGELRRIIVPQELMPKFLSLAKANTERNIETCGILAGKMSRNQFLITHLLVPQQVGTADSCTTQHEEELFAQQDKFDLITLGWIHTHPTQTAFLSSVDLHTHCSYQLMMPEAIAIVCAPKFNETGYFTLTANHGLPFIANCRESGFHPHPKEPPLFQGADHVVVELSAAIVVIDMRR